MPNTEKQIPKYPPIPGNRYSDTNRRYFAIFFGDRYRVPDTKKMPVNRVLITGTDTTRDISTGDKPFVCDQGDKKISLKVTFVNHQRKHSGEMPYKCDQCDERFSQRSFLVSYEKTHTAEKPYNVICMVNILYLKLIA